MTFTSCIVSPSCGVDYNFILKENGWNIMTGQFPLINELPKKVPFFAHVFSVYFGQRTKESLRSTQLY